MTSNNKMRGRVMLLFSSFLSSLCATALVYVYHHLKGTLSRHVARCFGVFYKGQLACLQYIMIIYGGSVQKVNDAITIEQSAFSDIHESKTIGLL